MATYKINLQLINSKNQPLSGLTAQVWLSDQKKGEALTDKDGNCSVSFALPEGGGKKATAAAYVLVYLGEKWIYGAKDGPQYPLTGSELNLQLTINARRADLIPLTLKDFRLSAENLGGLTATQRNYVATKLNNALQAAVQQALEQADKRFQEEPVAVALDYTQLLDKTLGAVLTEKAIPVIRTNRSFEPAVEFETQLAQNPRSVREILHIDQPLIKNPIFYEAIQVLRTTSLTDTLLPGKKELPDLLLDRALDWERASVEQWDALVAEGVIGTNDKPVLQRGFALSRFTGGQTALVGRLMQQMTDLSQIATYDAEQLLAHIQAAGGETPGGESPEVYAANLEQLAQRNFPSVFFLERKVQRTAAPETYRHLSVKGVEGQGHLKKFMSNNGGLDLRTADFFKKNDSGELEHNYGDIPVENREGVRAQMMAFQRVLRLTDSYKAQEALLTAGIDSSSQLVQKEPAEVRQLLGNSLDRASIDDILVRAEQQYQLLVNGAVAMQSISSAHAVGFATAVYPDHLINQLRDIDGYEQMFGSQDYCECDHCKSIFGPAAYFVDLMKFTENKVALIEPSQVPLTDQQTHPISLRMRRPDLWSLELTCENTNATIPYLQIINEIKQHYIAEVMASTILPRPVNPVDVWAEFARQPLGVSGTGLRHGLAANAGNTWKNSFRLCFNRPFEESQILLEYFGLDYTDILKALRVKAQYRMEQAYLGISSEEWQVLVTPDSSMEDLRNLRFGFPPEKDYPNEPGYFKLTACSAPAFLRATSLSYADAAFLLSDKSSLRTITPAVTTPVKLVRIQVQGQIQEYKEYIEGLGQAPVLDFIHRLLRLKRHVPWTLRELDMVVQAVGGLDAADIVRIARICEIQRLLNLTVEEALAMHQGIPNTSLYTRSTYNALLNSSAETPVPGMLNRLFDLSKLPLDGTIDLLPTTMRQEKAFPALLSGLNMTEDDYERAYQMLPPNPPTVTGNPLFLLDIRNLSALYRVGRLAKAFGLSVEEMGYLVKLSDLPFDTVNAGRILIWARLLEAVRKMPLSLQEIWFVIKGAETANVKSAYVRPEILENSAKTLTRDFLADSRLYVSKEALQEYLPSEKRVSHIDAFIILLTNIGILFKTNKGYRIAQLEPLTDTAIPRSFNLAGAIYDLNPSENNGRIVLDALKVSELTAWLNKQHIVQSGESVPEKILREHLSLLFKTTPSRIADMQSWFPGYSQVWEEVKANMAVKNESDIKTVELRKILPLLERLNLLFDRLDFDEADVVHLSNPAQPAALIQILASAALPTGLHYIDVIGQITNYAHYKKQAGDPATVEAYRQLLNTKNSHIPDHSTLIAALLGCEGNQVTAMIAVWQESVDSNLLFTVDSLRQIEDMVDVFGKLRMYEKSVIKAWKDNNYNAALQYESALRTAFRARFTTEAAYEKAWEPYENRINELRRDVLCAFLLALDRQNNFHDTGDLYAYFLVDVEMSGCARVSRILEATLALQVYMHRVLMGLEATAKTAPVPARALLGGASEEAQKTLRAQWEWRKNYRVWEANRKVFLYPENWIEPELRNDKSPLFKTLEDELLQQKISLESAEQAYVQYLKGFAEVGQLVIAGMYYETDKETYHIFGRTATDPYQYYYRKMKVLPKNISTGVREKQWTAWEKVELAIDAPYVSPIMHNGKLFVFWVGVVTMEKTAFDGGNTKFLEFSHNISLSYSNLTENGKWLQPQKVKDFAMGEREFSTVGDNAATKVKALEYLNLFEKNLTRLRVYPHYSAGGLRADYFRYSKINNPSNITHALDLSHNYADKLNTGNFTIPKKNTLLLFSGPYDNFLYASNPLKENGLVDAGKIEERLFDFDFPDQVPLVEGISKQYLKSDLRLVFGRIGDHILRNENHQFLLRHIEETEMVKGPGSLYYDSPRRESIMLTTTIIDSLITKLSKGGLDAFLNLNTQRDIWEHPHLLVFNFPSLLAPPFFETDRLDFSGAHGLYFCELFFHIPFLIADHLNAEGKFKEADYWYRKIFDPSAAYNASDGPEDRYWQFVEFRKQTLPQLLDILNDSAAIAAYEDDPFNPHAIARVRSGPYQKAILMKYVDNLIDWGDSLFRRDTWESNTEAMLLYQLAHDILGKRPGKTGPCASLIDTENCGCVDPKTTYAKIKSLTDKPFVYFIENWINTNATEAASGTVLNTGAVFGYQDALATAQPMGTKDLPIPKQRTGSSYAVDFGKELFRQNVFCIPHNEKIFDYHDRVADRLYKLRHCMNIDGVKRSLALFQPPIDPALLVAAFAAGLNVEDVLNSLYSDLPAYRFSYLVEKAKAFAGTVQSFGGALLSALEKKDSEALTLLRSTQEQNILKMTKDVKKKAIEEAKANLQSTVEGMINTMNRVTQYKEWLEENLNSWERTQQVSKHTQSVLLGIEPTLRIIAGLTHLILQVGAPTSMKYGGKELGDSMKSFADVVEVTAQLAGLVSDSAGLEASFQRRAQDWKFQLKTAEQEIKQVQQQIAAATIRLAIAEKDLEIHEKQIEQAADLHDFYKNKFTGLGLYNYMAASLQRLHRMAYNTAIDMAKQAEAAYKFETGNDSVAISAGAFWDASRVGLLSGEQLTLELQQLETDFINWNYRQMEVRQSFSMRMLDPDALLNLREEGICTFTIPEWAFDMQYPGHYRRRIVSVQITIPCVAGPYHNIAATLTMTKGSIRKGTSSVENTDVFPFRGSSMIATSSANNDGGQFDLNFRDERFLPFEGAGAVDSEWVLELPAKLRSFDYRTISDVIFNISYRSKYDGGIFKTNVESSITTKMGTLKRLISLKEEFPDALFQLQSSSNHTVELVLDNSYLPMFAQAANSFVVKAKIASSDTWGTEISKENGKYSIALTPRTNEDVYIMLEYTLSKG